MRNGRGKRDERIRELRERGLSLRAIGRRVGLGRSQVSRILDAMATGDPAAIVSAVAYEDELHAAHITPEMIAADLDIWRRLSSVERYRFAHIKGGWWVPAHDPDHQLCCLAHGYDPDWFDSDGRYVATDSLVPTRGSRQTSSVPTTRFEALRATQSHERGRGGVIRMGRPPGRIARRPGR